MNTRPPTPSEIIDRIGGTAATAALCKRTPGAVSQWRNKAQLPDAIEMYLREARPEVFAEVAG